MISTFHGLETARRSLTAHQAALHTTGHNIANANTPGYSRQRVNLTQGEPFPSPAINRPAIPGQLGTGVRADSIQRYREEFLDLQFRGENSKLGYWDARFTALQKMEDIMNEPSQDGLATAMDRFWTSLQDLSVHPEDSGARSVVRQRGYALAETFNYVSNSLQTIQRDMVEEANWTVRNINSLLDQINKLNIQISKTEPHGYVPNDLYDRRDLLVDQLSELVNIKVERNSSKGMPSSVAEGVYTIKLADEKGNAIDPPVTLVHGNPHDVTDFGKISEVSLETAAGYGGLTVVNFITFTTPGDPERSFSIEDFKPQGKLKGQIEALGYNTFDGNGVVGESKGLFPNMIKELDLMVFTFVNEFNAVHRNGWSLNDIQAGVKTPPEGLNFFDIPNVAVGAASSIKLSDNIRNELNNIAAASQVGNPGTAFSGDGSNAQALANIKDKVLDYGGTNTNVHSFYQGVIGEMAVNTNEADRMKRNSETLRSSVDQRRMSASSVSLDEEFTNMIKFQHAYNAAARNITSVDDMLDRIINRMGRVGL